MEIVGTIRSRMQEGEQVEALRHDFVRIVRVTGVAALGAVLLAACSPGAAYRAATLGVVPEVFAGATILTSAIAATLLMLIGRIRRRRQRVQLATSPWVRAVTELDRLERLDLPGAGRHREFYTRISLLLRRYIEEMFEVQAPGMSTEEYLFALRKSPALGRHRRSLSELLHHWDVVKFAAYLPAQDDAGRAVACFRAFIESTSATSRRLADEESNSR